MIYFCILIQQVLIRRFTKKDNNHITVMDYWTSNCEQNQSIAFHTELLNC